VSTEPLALKVMESMLQWCKETVITHWIQNDRVEIKCWRCLEFWQVTMVSDDLFGW